MNIKEHSESHIVKLDDGSEWQIFPSDIDLTLGWLPTTDLTLVPTEDEFGSHALVDGAEGTRVRVLAVGKHWPIREVKDALKEG